MSDVRGGSRIYICQTLVADPGFSVFSNIFVANFAKKVLKLIKKTKGHSSGSSSL